MKISTGHGNQVKGHCCQRNEAMMQNNWFIDIAYGHGTRNKQGCKQISSIMCYNVNSKTKSVCI